MRRNFLRMVTAYVTALFLIPSVAIHAQVTEISAEAVAFHDGMVGNSDLTGMTTYRIYAHVTSAEDFVGAVYGNASQPIDISTTTSFFQHPAGGSFGTDLNQFFLNILQISITTVG